MRFATLIIFGLVLALVPVTRAETISFYDDTFNPEDWESSIFYEEGNGGVYSWQQELVGGNPGAFMMIVNTVFSAPPYSMIRVFYHQVGAVYDPSTQGAILSIDYSEDSIMLEGGGDGQGSGPTLEQDGVVFVAPRFLTPETEWTPHVLTGLTQDDFAVWDDPDHHPDFSINGSPIFFGFQRGNATYSGGYTIVGGIDNWTTTLHTEGCTPTSPATWAGIKRAFGGEE